MFTCGICWEAFRKEHDIWSTACGHVFHKNCLHDWIRRNNSCPECRKRNVNPHKLFLNFLEGSSSRQSNNSNLTQNPSSDDLEPFVRVLSLEQRVKELQSEVSECHYVISQFEVRNSQSGFPTSSRSGQTSAIVPHCRESSTPFSTRSVDSDSYDSFFLSNDRNFADLSEAEDQMDMEGREEYDESEREEEIFEEAEQAATYAGSEDEDGELDAGSEGDLDADNEEDWNTDSDGGWITDHEIESYAESEEESAAESEVFSTPEGNSDENGYNESDSESSELFY